MTIRYIGDTHIGKKFKTGVPLNRLGERENLIYNKFEEQLKEDSDLTVHLGDLFDSPIVSYDDLYKTFKIIEKEALEHPEKKLVFLAGNHDISRDLERPCSFLILKEMLNNFENIFFVLHYYLCLNVDNVGKFMFIPYQQNDQLTEIIQDCTSNNVELSQLILCGHFDEPYDPLVYGLFKEVHTGHIHLPRVQNNIIVHGSIIPMNFGEDPEGGLYRTLTLKEFEEVISDPTDSNMDWQNQCFRIILKDGETLPAGVNCRQLISIKEDTDSGPILDEKVDFEPFDINNLFHEALDDLGLYEEIYKKYLEYKQDQNI